MRTMRTAVAFAALAVTVWALAVPFQAHASVRANLPEGQDRVMIPVEGMTCGACAASITRSVRKLDGIVDIEVDHLKGAVTVVRIVEKVTVDQIVEAINRTGFKATNPEKA